MQMRDIKRFDGKYDARNDR